MPKLPLKFTVHLGWFRPRVLLLAVLAVACGGQIAQESEEPSDTDAGGTRLTVEELPPMPPYPAARSGRLVTQSAGGYDIHGAWRTQAGLCDTIGIMEIYAGQPGLGTALVLRIPEGDPIGDYPVVAAAADLPAAPAALIAVQVFEDPEALGFQAYHGLLELTELDEKVSGRFTATLREIGQDLLTHYVGVFERIQVEPLGADYCRALRDSTLAPDSAAASDTAAHGG